MEYVYATLTLHESSAEINEDNLTAVLEAAGTAVEESRVKAIVAALEDVDLMDIAESATVAATTAADTSEEPDTRDADVADEAADGGPFAELEYPRPMADSEPSVPDAIDDEAEDR